MAEYKNTAENYPQFRKILLTKSIITVLVLVIGSTCITYFSGDLNSGEIDWDVWLIFSLFLVVTFTYASIKGIKRQKDIYYSYKLTITDDHLLRQQSNLPPVTLAFSDITSITENTSGFLNIKGNQKGSELSIWPYLDNYGHVKELIQKAQPATQPISKNSFHQYTTLIIIIMMAASAGLYISNNKIVVALCGIFTISILIVSIYKIRASPQIDINIKRKSFWAIIVLISIIAITYNKLFTI